MFHIFKRLSLFFGILFVPINLLLSGESPVLENSPLRHVSSDFELADGPSWDGWSLTIPDPFTEKTIRFVPSKEEWLPGPQGRRISATFYNHGQTFFVDNGKAEILKREGNNNNKTKLILLHKENLEKDKSRRPNDLVVDRSGGVFFTLTGAGQVVYIPPGKPGVVVANNIKTANGLILSPDEIILYVSEAGPRQVLAYDVGSEGKLSGRRVFAKMDGIPEGKKGGADGMTIDRAGNVYCAGPAKVWIWAPDGELLGKIACPERPVNCSFGGTSLRDLYITGFGGLYLQKMRISGVSAQPPASWPPEKAKIIPSVAVPKGVTAHMDLTYARYGTRNMLADIFVPSGEGPHPAAIILHGGGWHSGDKMKFRAMGLDLARRDTWRWRLRIVSAVKPNFLPTYTIAMLPFVFSVPMRQNTRPIRIALEWWVDRLARILRGFSPLPPM